MKTTLVTAACAAIIVSTAACAATSSEFNPDSLGAVQLARVADVCQTVLA